MEGLLNRLQGFYVQEFGEELISFHPEQVVGCFLDTLEDGDPEVSQHESHILGFWCGSRLTAARSDSELNVRT